MFLHSIHALAQYNHWANEKFSAAFNTLTGEQYHKKIVSSFDSILKTMAHIHGAEDVWRQRLQHTRPTKFYTMPEVTSGAVETTKWIDSSQRLTDLILSYNENDLVDKIEYFRADGSAQVSFRWQMIQHCVNHSTYHRGQLVTMLRQLGINSVPNTDLISYFRQAAEAR